MPPNKSLERTRDRESAKLEPQRTRRSAQPLGIVTMSASATDKPLFLFTDSQLPCGFKYPTLFQTLVSDNALPDLEPWWFLCIHEETANFWLKSLKEQYPKRTLVPFAKLAGSDDLACFDGSHTTGNPPVQYIHAFAGPGWEHRGEVTDFGAWLEEAHARSKEWHEERAGDA